MGRIKGTNLNDSLVGGDRYDLLTGLGGLDILRGGAGNDGIFGGSGADSIFGDGGYDRLFGGFGADQITGGTGSDYLYGGFGDDFLDGGSENDFLDGGAGSDTVNGDSGNDVAVYVVGANARSSDVYIGGSGVDTLRIRFTAAEWNRSGVQAEITSYLAFLTAQTNPSSGEAGEAVFAFSKFGLRASSFERLEIYVDGQLVNVSDHPVSAADDSASVNENNSVTIQILSNDSVPDGLQSVSLVTPPARGTLALQANNTFLFTADAAFDNLAAGQQTTESFTYLVTDADGDSATATVVVTINGSNDGAVITGQASALAVEDSAAAVGGTLAATDVDSTATFVAQSNVAGSYGRFSINSAGVWTYLLDNSNAAVNVLNTGSAPLTDTLTVATADGTTQQLSVTITGTNDAPILSAALTDQTATTGSAFSFTVPAGTFTDPDSALDLSATLDSGTPLPSWLSFNPATGQFSGTPGAGDTGSVSVRVTASDGVAAPVSDDVVISVAGGGGEGPPAPVFGLSGSDETAPGQTTAKIVSITGRTGANVTVQLFRAGGATPVATSPSDVNGEFSFTGIVLNPGVNGFYALATDASTGLTSQSSPVDITLIPSVGVANAAVAWNAITLDAIKMAAAAPTTASRALAMESLAVFNTLAAINGTKGYLFSAAAAPDASAEAAIAQAAHDVLAHLFPSRANALAAELADALVAVPEGPEKAAGVALGASVAETVIQLRDGDGWKDSVIDAGSQDTGKWQPTGPFYAPALDAQWANLETFALVQPGQFDPGAPPAAIPDTVTTDGYANDYERTLALGRADSADRTADQTALARFWADGAGTQTPSGHWNAIATGAIASEGLGLAESVRLLLQLNLATADSGIAAWNTKFAYDTWRPETAFQDGGTFGGVTITPDRDWQPLLITPPFPEYISGHSTYSGAAATILTAYFGEDFSFSSTTTSLPGNVTRSFNSFWDAANEAGASRIYGGIHFEFSNEAGKELGRDIGIFVLGMFNGAADTSPPKIAFLTPENLVTRTAPTIRGIATDTLTGVARLSYTLDGGPLIFLTPAADGSFAIPTLLAADGSADGRHRLTISAVDAAGNASAFATFNFSLAATGPTLTLAAQAIGDGSTVTSTSLLAGDFDLDDGVDLAGLTYRLDGGGETPVAFAADGSFSTPLDLKTLAAGPHVLTLTGTDTAGNVVSRTLNVTTTAPDFYVTDVSPDPNEMGVGVTFRPQIEFSRAADVATLNSNSLYAVDATGARLAATVVPYADGTGAWLLFDAALPGASTITIQIEGDLIRSIDGEQLDAQHVGATTSDLAFDFTTVSNTPVAGTTITGLVLDPGADLVPMTPDDARAGPDQQLAGFADNIWLNRLAGVKVYILGRENEAVYTAADGSFSLTNVPAGHVKVAIDGRTATNAPAGFFFPEMVMDVLVTPGVANTVMGGMGTREARAANAENPSVYLPRIDVDILVPVSPTAPTTVYANTAAGSNITAEQLQHLSLTIQPGSLVDENGNPVANPTIGISTVPPQIVMDMLPPGVLQHSFDITIQAPGGAVFTQPAILTMPNVFGLAPGEKQYVLSFDHTTGKLVINGTATVSADGLTVTTDPDSGIMAPGWHGLGPPGSLGEGKLSMRCPPRSDAIANFSDLESAALNVAGHVGTLNDLAGGTLLGESRIVKGAQQIATLRSDSNQVLGTMTEIANAWYAGDTGGYGPADAGYYLTMGGKLLGDIGKTTIDVGATVVDKIPALEGTSIDKFFDVAPKVITAAETVGTWTSGGSVFQPIKDFEQKVEQQVAQNQVNANWTPPPVRELPTAQARLDATLNQAVINDNLRTPLLNKITDNLRQVLDRLDGWDESQPLGGIDVPDLVNPDGSSPLVDAVKAFAEAAEDAARIQSALDDADAIARAFADYLDAIANDLGMEFNVDDITPAPNPIDPGPILNPPIIDDPLVIEYGPTICYVLKNLRTQDEQRGKFDAVGGFNQFLAPNTPYKLTVFDPVSKEMGTVVFISSDTGVRTRIPDITMYPDRGSVGPGGLTPTAAYVLGLNPNRPDNLIPGITDAEALQTGLAETPQQANVNGVIGKVNLLGDAKAITILASGSNSAQQIGYVATGSQGLAIVDLTNPRTPTVLAQLDLPGDATDVAVDGPTRYAAVATGAGLSIIDASDASRPRLLYTINATATQVETANSLLYFVADGVLTAYDMLAREAVGYLTLPGSGAATGLTTDGQHLYVLRSGATARDVIVVDITGELALEGRLTLPRSQSGVDFSFDGRLVVGDGILYIPAGTPAGSNGGYATVDVRNPAAPVLTSGVDNGSIAASAIALNDSGKAVGVQQQGLFGLGSFDSLDVFDVRNPANTGDFLSRINLNGGTTAATPFASLPLDVAIANGMAFVATQDGLTVVQYLRPDRAGVRPTASIDLSAYDVDPIRAGIQIVEGSRISIPVATNDDVQVRNVEMLVNGVALATDVSPSFVLDPTLPGRNTGSTVTIQARATDTGGNNGLSNAVTVELVAETRPFALVGVTPALDQTVPLSTRKVTYIFSTPVDPATIAADRFQLRDANGVLQNPVGLELRAGGTRVEVTYDSLAAGVYTATIKAAAIFDALGRQLGAGDFTGVNQFTVGPFDNIWIAGSQGLWSDVGSWNTGTLPAAGENILVPLATGAVAKFDRLVNPLPNDGAYGGVSVTGGGTLQIGETNTTFNGISNPFQDLVTENLSSSARIVIESRGALTIRDGELFNAGHIETKANFIPVGGFQPGSSGRIYLRGAEVTISGGGVIELGTANVALGENDLRSQFSGYGIGNDVTTNGGFTIERTRLIAVTNVDNTIRGGGEILGSMNLHNVANGIIESTLDTRLKIDLFQFVFVSNNFGAYSYYERATLQNEGIVRATASSTLQINGTNVLNQDGELLADGDNSLLLITGTSVISGGVIRSTTANANIWIENGSFVDGAVLDARVGNDVRAYGVLGLIDTEIFGNVFYSYSAGNIPGNPAPSITLGGTIKNHDELTIFNSPSRDIKVSFFRDTVFTGGGLFSMYALGTTGRLLLDGGVFDYPFREATDPVPEAPEPVTMVNDDNTFQWAGVVKPYRDVRTFPVYDPILDENTNVARPATRPLQIENLKDGIIESFLIEGFDPVERPLEFDGMTINNSGLIRANNGCTLSIKSGLLNNDWFDYDPTVAGSLRTPYEGTIRAEFGNVVLSEATVIGGHVEASPSGGQSGIVVVEGAGDGVTRFFGVDLGLGNGSVSRIKAGAALQLVDRTLTGGDVDRTSIDLDGELSIEADASSGFGNGLLIGSEGFGSDVTIRGSGRLTLLTETGAIETAGVRSVGSGGTLRLSGVTVAGSGDLGDAGLDITITGDAPVNLEASNQIRIGATRLSVEAGARLVDQGGDILIESEVTNDGVIDATDGTGAFVFNGVVFNNSELLAGSSTSFTFQDSVINGGTMKILGGQAQFNNYLQNNGEFRLENDAAVGVASDVTGGGQFWIDDDGVLTFDSVVAGGTIAFNPFEDGNPHNGRLVIGDSDQFNAIIDAFSAGDLIDLADIDFASLQTPSFSYDGPDVVMGVTDGEDTASLRFYPGNLGSYDIDKFQLQDRGDGVTQVSLLV